MRKALVGLLGVCLLALIVGSVSARDIDKNGLRFMQVINEEDPALIDQGAHGLLTSADTDTFCIVWFTFEPADLQGFQLLDHTAQLDKFWRVDDFDGLGGGHFGRLVPLEGTKSMWCGVRYDANNTYICGWVAAPGYGNNWNQPLESSEIPFAGILTLSFKATFDSEPDYDYTYIQYDAGNGNWVTIADGAYDGLHQGVFTHDFALAQASTKLRFLFQSDGAWSNQDGLSVHDGGAIIDSIVVSDRGGPGGAVRIINTETFETANVGDHGAGIWNAVLPPGYGSYAGLWINLEDKDPCAENFGTQVVFFSDGVDFGPISIDYPGLYDTPFCKGPGGTEGPCQDASLVSPVIRMTHYSPNNDHANDTPIPGDLNRLTGATYLFTVYRDLPLDNLVFYTWAVRNLGINAQGQPLPPGCPGPWRHRGFVYYGGDQDYIFGGFDVSDLVGNHDIQIRVGAVDMCQYWYVQYGSCARHTPSPWIDNLRVYRYDAGSPAWTFRDLDLFQDTFPTEELNMESFARADAANDINRSNIVIIPGDSAVVGVAAPVAGGIDSVLCYLRFTYIGPGSKSDPWGANPEDMVGTVYPSIGGTITPTPAGTYIGEAGGWHIIQMPQALTSLGTPVADRYMIDLNDEMLTRGWMVEYYFKAWDVLGSSTTLPSRAEQPGGRVFEFTVLPTLNSDALFVDDFHGRGTFDGLVESYFNPAFEAVTTVMPDKYDVNAPSSGVSNGIGARVRGTNRFNFVTEAYEKIIIDSGNLSSITISDGGAVSDKSDDAQLFIDWLLNSEHKVGLWVLGNDVAWDLTRAGRGASAGPLLNLCGLDGRPALLRSYYDLTGGRVAGGVITPLVTSVTGGPFDDPVFGPLQYYAYGGCPIIKSFDVLTPIEGVGFPALRYPDFPSGTPRYAGIYTDGQNENEYTMRTIWMGHSFMYVRDVSGSGIPARNRLVQGVWDFFENERKLDITDATPEAKVYSLAQNFPNPFNPATTIGFSLAAKGHVNLRIYDVAGRLVRTLADGVYDHGSHTLTWDGTNNLGSSVASGVYFYKLTAGGEYENMKKMVLLR